MGRKKSMEKSSLRLMKADAITLDEKDQTLIQFSSGRNEFNQLKVATELRLYKAIRQYIISLSETNVIDDKEKNLMLSALDEVYVERKLNSFVGNELEDIVGNFVNTIGQWIIQNPIKETESHLYYINSTQYHIKKE